MPRHRFAALAATHPIVLAAALLPLFVLPVRAESTPAAAAAGPAADKKAAPVPTTKPLSTTPQRRRRHFWIGPQLGLYIPTNSRTRDAFGSSWFQWGVGLGQVEGIVGNGRLNLDLNVLAAQRSQSTALIVPVGVAYTLPLAPVRAKNVPFVGLSADGMFANLQSTDPSIGSGSGFTGGGSVFVGDRFARGGYIEARYHAYGRVRGFDLSGAELQLGLRF